VCDLIEDRLKMTIEMVKKAKGNTPAGYGKDEYDYRNMCQRDDLDAVVVATGVQKLARISADAMKAGKHVGSEVCGAHTLEDCWAIVKAKESSGKRYMLLENCCYGNVNMAIFNMVQQGVFGELYCAECSYIHDGRATLRGSDRIMPGGSLSWRGLLARDAYGICYSPHALGSVAKWLGINDGDRMEYCTCIQNDPKGVHDWLVQHYAADSAAAKIEFKRGDYVSSLIHTAKGRVIRVDEGFACTRPYTRYYLLSGMNGTYDSRTGIHIRGVSPHYDWEPFEKHSPKYQHNYWRASGDKARKAGGHGGMDYLCLRDFAEMVREDREPWIDVYDCASWASLYHCSHLSLERKSQPVEFPDFTGGRWKDPNWRKDNHVPA
jgi:hypothetical protein